MHDYKTGWIYQPNIVDEFQADLPYPLVGDADLAIRNTGNGKTTLLYKSVEEILGSFNVRRQKGPDCVSVSSAGAIDCLKAYEIKRLNEPELWTGETCSEDIYGGSRVQIGGGRLGRSGGSFGIWAAKYVSEIGSLVRKKYNSYDLSSYNWDLADVWDTQGVPEELLSIAREHPVRTVSKVTSWQQAKDLLANGYPITLAGNVGFSDVRDRDGFARRSGSWAHQMYLGAIDDVGQDCYGGRNRPGGLIINSWGRWNSGPKRLGQPDGSFWVEPQDLEQYFKYGDCWAYSNFQGFRKKFLDLNII